MDNCKNVAVPKLPPPPPSLSYGQVRSLCSTSLHLEQSWLLLWQLTAFAFPLKKIFPLLSSESAWLVPAHAAVFTKERDSQPQSVLLWGHKIAAHKAPFHLPLPILARMYALSVAVATGWDSGCGASSFTHALITLDSVSHIH